METIDPFDVAWTVTDPIGRDVFMLKSIAKMREVAGKHSSDIERLDVSGVRKVVEEPDEIAISSSIPTRDIYYRKEDDREHPYARAVVDFSDGERGIVISYSRYKHQVKSSGTRWPEK